MAHSPVRSSASSYASSGSFPHLSSSRLVRRRQLSASAAGTARAVAFLSAILSAVCAGSVTVFSLYGHIFQERLRYSQFQVNGVAIAASISCYLPVSAMGYVCDRVGPAPLSLLSSILFGVGYSTAALLYRKAASTDTPTGPTTQAYAFMVTAFVLIGSATCAMYLSAVATCAKNFGRGRHRGLALAAPIAAFGLSGMWQSQLGSRVLYERLPPRPEDGPGAPPRKGDVDVFAFFVFLAVLLAVVGLLGTFTLRVVDEEQLVDDAAEHLERSGLLDGSALFAPTVPALGDDLSRSTRFGPGVSGSNSNNSNNSGRTSSYGTMGRTNPFFDGARSDDDDDDATVAHHGHPPSQGRRQRLRGHSQVSENDSLIVRLLDPSKDGDDDAATAAEAQARVKKAWLLNAETHRFLTDHTMWLFALGFFFMIGPGEAFINNLGTVIQTLYPPVHTVGVHVFGAGSPTTAATHVSIVGMTSTLARLVTGSLTDLLAPRPQTQHLQVARDDYDGGDGGDEDEDEDERSVPYVPEPATLVTLMGRWRAHVWPMSVSRVAFLLAFALMLSAGLVVLASGAVQGHGERFWLVSGLVGAGYGAVFSLTPIIITVIWGVENFGTNWGIVAMFPALGATVWGLVYSAVYQAGVAEPGDGSHDTTDTTPAPAIDGRCYGTQCYAPTFWAMAVSVWAACVLVLLAWKGRNGWSQRGIVI